MKPSCFVLMLFFMGLTAQLSAQSDSSSVTQQSKGHRDSLYAAKLNYTGNLMIGGGVGLAGAASFLIYEGVQTYKTPAPPTSTYPAADVARNHNQGAAYCAAGGVAYAAAAVLIALGARNKIEFKRRKKMMSLEGGLLQNGNMGAMLNF